MTYATVLQELSAATKIDDRRKVFNSDIEVRAEYRAYVCESVRKMSADMLVSFEAWLTGKVAAPIEPIATVTPIPEGLSDEVLELLALIDNPAIPSGKRCVKCGNHPLAVAVNNISSINLLEKDNKGKISTVDDFKNEEFLELFRSALIVYGIAKIDK